MKKQISKLDDLDYTVMPSAGREVYGPCGIAIMIITRLL